MKIMKRSREKYEDHTFSSRLREAMGNMTQNELAAAIGASQGAISRWLAGAVIPHKSSLQKAAHVLGVTPQWLLSGAEPKYLDTTSSIQETPPGYGSNAPLPHAASYEVHKTDPLADALETAALALQQAAQILRERASLSSKD
jgi:transcriptional regulator with XRE-family HTH domain